MGATNSSEETLTIDESELHNVDLCFMIDCTSSMSHPITMAKAKMNEIIDQIKAQYSDSVVRIAVVAYRDIWDWSRFEVLQFTNSVDEAKDFIGKLVAKGGADNPEDVNGGFQKVLWKLKWKSLTRMLYHIADAPCHGLRFHDDVHDNYPKGHRSDESWDKIFGRLRKLKISYLLLDVNNGQQKMFDEFQKIYKQNETQDDEQIFQREYIGPVSYSRFSAEQSFETNECMRNISEPSKKASSECCNDYSTGIYDTEDSASKNYVKATVVQALNHQTNMINSFKNAKKI